MHFIMLEKGTFLKPKIYTNRHSAPFNGVSRMLYPPLLHPMNWSVKRGYDTILGRAGDSEIVTFGNYLAELFAPFLAYRRASSHNAMLAWQDIPNSGQNFTLRDALVASERRLGP
jgi:hypothetical protein